MTKARALLHTIHPLFLYPVQRRIISSPSPIQQNILPFIRHERYLGRLEHTTIQPPVNTRTPIFRDFLGFLAVGVVSALGLALIEHLPPSKEKYWIRTGGRDDRGYPIIEEVASAYLSNIMTDICKTKPAMLLLPGVGTTHGSTAISTDGNNNGHVYADIDDLKKMLGGYSSCLGKLFPSGSDNIILSSWGNALNARYKAYNPKTHENAASSIFNTLSPILETQTDYPLVILGFSQGGSSLFHLRKKLETSELRIPLHTPVICIALAPSKHTDTPIEGNIPSIPLITIISPDDQIAEKPTKALIDHLTTSQIYIEEDPQKNSVVVYVRNRTACLEKNEDNHALKSYLGCQLSREVIQSLLEEVSKRREPNATFSAIEIVRTVATHKKWEVVSDRTLRIQAEKENAKNSTLGR